MDDVSRDSRDGREVTCVHMLSDRVYCKGSCRVGGGRQNVVLAANDDNVGCVASTLGHGQ